MKNPSALGTLTGAFEQSQNTLSTLLATAFMQAYAERQDTKQACLEVLNTYVSQGRIFSSQPDDLGYTDAMRIADYAGLEGLKLFAEHGGKFNPQAQTWLGKETELMLIAKYTGTEGLKFFFENGGNARISAKDYLGRSEREFLAALISDSPNHGDRMDERVQPGYQGLMEEYDTGSLVESQTVMISLTGSTSAGASSSQHSIAASPEV